MTKASPADTASLMTSATQKLEVKDAGNEPLDMLLRELSREAINKNKESNQTPLKNTANTSAASSGPTKTEVKSNKHSQTFYQEVKPPLDDNSAIELHKSKSYIVSLIDKALSKELGTVPGDKCTRKEVREMEGIILYATDLKRNRFKNSIYFVVFEYESEEGDRFGE